MNGISGLLDGYYKVMSNSPKNGHLPIPVMGKLTISMAIFNSELLVITRG